MVAVCRAGFIHFLRNIAAALGNALTKTDKDEQPHIITALNHRLGQHDLLDEHIQWALAQKNETQ